MRLPWPDHVNTKGGIYFALLLMAVQISLGTSPFFAVSIFIYVIETVIAFNLAGGLYTFAGSFIFFQSTQSILISQVAKCCFLQAADTNLLNPQKTAMVYALGGLGTLGAVLVSNKMLLKQPIYDARKHDITLMPQSIVASTIGIFALIVVGVYGFSDEGIAHGSILSYLNQLPNFLPLGVMIGTAHIIRTSNGTRSARWYTIIPIVYQIITGFVLNTKQGIFQPLLVWLAVGAVYRYKFAKLQLLGFAAFTVFAAVFIFPYIQYSRSEVREGNIYDRAVLVYNFTRDNGFTKVRAAYKLNQALREESGEESAFLYYGTDEEALDRFSLIENEDALIHRVDLTTTHGMKPLWDTVLYLTALFIWRDKYVIIAFTNLLGREIGVISDEDYGTFISFSMYAPAYYMEGWIGVLFLPFFSLAFYFTVINIFYGTAKENAYCLLPILGNLHGAAEATPVAPLGALVQYVPASFIIIRLTRILSPAVSIFLAKSGLQEKNEFSTAESQDRAAAAIPTGAVTAS